MSERVVSCNKYFVPSSRHIPGVFRGSQASNLGRQQDASLPFGHVGSSRADRCAGEQWAHLELIDMRGQAKQAWNELQIQSNNQTIQSPSINSINAKFLTNATTKLKPHPGEH